MIEIKTEQLKDAVAKAIKGSGQLPMLMITNCIGIELKNGVLTLSTTDGSTNLYVNIKGFNESASFYACTMSSLFSSLVSKTTTNTIGLEIRDTSLFFRGNGIYNLPIIQDEEGNIVRIPELKLKEEHNAAKVTANKLRALYKYNKLTVAKTKEIPCFSAYCVSNSKIYTYNSSNLCISKTDLNGFNMLLPGSVAPLLELVPEKDMSVEFDGTIFSFTSDTIKIIGTVTEGFDKFPIAAADELLANNRFKTKVELNKVQLVNVLDRMSLFILPEDMNSIYLDFKEDSVTITNHAGNGCEQCLYLSSPVGKPDIKTSVDISDLKMIISAVEVDSVTLGISEEGYVCVELIDSNIVIPSISDEEFDEDTEATETAQEEVEYAE